ncbi:MAG: DUF4838 domain-containing protein [Bryobacteraceae bacterium]
MRLTLILTTIVLCATAPCSGVVTLVENGKSAYSIVLSSSASPSEKRGAAELQKYLEEISGARLPIVSDTGAAAGPFIFVGSSPRAGKLDLAPLGAEGFVLRTSGSNLIIAGGRQRGTMYGVYAFLDKLGCRWFTSEVSRIPKQRTIRIEPLNETHKPAFEYREPFFTEAFDKDWAARNRTNGHFSHLDESAGGKVQYHPFVHSFYEILPPGKHFRGHPEYFSLIDGVRVHERGQLCLTNPAVLRLSTQVVHDWIRQHPEATIFSVSQNDWEGWCECDNCRCVERDEGGEHSGPLLRFVNALAAEVEKQHPDKLIDTLAYMYTENPPLKVRPRRNVRVRLCPIGACEAHPYEKCPRNAYFIRNLREWSKVTNQLYIWHYNTNFSNYLLPFPDFDELAADLPMYQRHGVVGVFLEGAYPKGGGGENAELRSYVMARLLWDPSIDVNREIDEFLAAVYGAAAKPMRAWFDLLHQQVRPEGKGQHIFIRRSPYLSPEVISRGQALFDQAGSLAADDAVKHRVRKARLPLEWAGLVQSKAFEVRDGQYTPAGVDGLRQRFETFLNGLPAFGITSIHEGRDLASDHEEIARYLKPFAVATLESASLRVDVAPGLSGRVIRLIDKRTGRDALRRADPGAQNYPDLGGLRAMAMPDSHEKEWPAIWELDPASDRRQMVLAGRCANGVQLRRTLQLTGDGATLRTETRAENRSAEPRDVVIASTAEVSPGDADDPHMALVFRKRSGGAVDLTMINTGLLPSGTVSYLGQDLPEKEWRIESRRAGFALANSVEGKGVERCQARWRARGENIVGTTLYTPKRRLAPGESFVLRTNYWVRPLGPGIAALQKE